MPCESKLHFFFYVRGPSRGVDGGYDGRDNFIAGDI